MTRGVFLEGDRVSLELMDDDDCAFVAQQWNTESVRAQAGWPRLPLSGEDIADVGDRGDGGALFLVSHDGRHVGFVTLHELDWGSRHVEISYLIRPADQGNGYATEAVDTCLTYAFDELGLHKVYADITEGNTGSVQVVEGLGFEQEGVLRDQWYVDGEYKDVYRYGLLESER